MEEWLSADNIARIINKTSRTVRRMANKGSWSSKTYPVLGGRVYVYLVADLPADIQTAYAASLKLTLDDLKAQLKPAQTTSNDTKNPPRIDRYAGRTERRSAAPELEQTPEARLATASLRLQLLQAWSASGLSVQQFVRAYVAGVAVPELRDKLGQHGDFSAWQTLYNWLQEYHAHGLAGLAPKYPVSRGGDGASLDDRAKDYIRALYLDDHKPSYRDVERGLRQFGYTIPYWTIRRYLLHEVPASVKSYYRDGEKKYHDTYDPYISRDYSLFGSMDWGTCDHHMFDLVVRAYGRVFRPWLTVFIDLRSRMITGWHIDATPSTLTILRALAPSLREFGPWKDLILDNGKDMKSYWFAGDQWKSRRMKADAGFWDLTAGVAYECGMKIHFAQPYRGQSKPVERLFGTIISLFSRHFDTYVGSNTALRPDEAKRYWGAVNGKNKNEVRLTLEDLREAFASFVQYYNTVHCHRGDGMDGKTPQTVFEENLHERRVMSERFRQYVLSRREKRVVGRTGVSIDGVEYFAPEMIQYTTQQVEVRRSLDDIGTVSIWSLPARTYLFDAYNDLLRDAGVPEENNRRRRAAETAQRAIIQRYNRVGPQMRAQRKRPDELIAQDALRTAPPSMSQATIVRIVNGVDISNAHDDTTTPLRARLTRRRLKLPTDPD